MQSKFPSSDYSNINKHDIKITIGDIIINILLDSSFFIDTNPYTLSKHTHPLYELFIITQGKSLFYYDNKYVDVGKGDIFIVCPHVYHLLKNSSLKMRCFCFSFEFLSKKTLNKHIKQFEYSLQELSNIEMLVLKDNFSAIKILEEISYELCRGDYCCYEMVQSCFTKFFIHLLREMVKTRKEVKPERNNALRSLSDDIVRAEIIDVFFGNISITNSFENTNIEALAGLLKLSVSQTHRVLKKLYNMSFQEKLLQTRMQMASHLLLNSNQKNSEIAEILGYQTEGSYYRAFKKYYGCTPSQFIYK